MVERLANTEINARRIRDVEACFGSSGKPLSNVSRVLVGEGILTKLCRKKPKQRQFFLFNDIIVYGNIVINKKRYNKQNILELKNVRVEDIPENNRNFNEAGTFTEGELLRHGWLIISPSKTFAVYAQTAMEKQEWMSHMSHCIEEEIKKAGMHNVNTQSAPAWIPDAEASECMRCNKIKFTALQRRHHCRMCGYVVCNACSSKKCTIAHQSSKPLRVCDDCYEMIANGNFKNETPKDEVDSSTISQFHTPVESSDSDQDCAM